MLIQYSRLRLSEGFHHDYPRLRLPAQTVRKPPGRQQNSASKLLICSLTIPLGFSRKQFTIQMGIRGSANTWITTPKVLKPSEAPFLEMQAYSTASRPNPNRQSLHPKVFATSSCLSGMEPSSNEVR